MMRPRLGATDGKLEKYLKLLHFVIVQFRIEEQKVQKLQARPELQSAMS